jgi:hypothetical protein
MNSMAVSQNQFVRMLLLVAMISGTANAVLACADTPGQYKMHHALLVKLSPKIVLAEFTGAGADHHEFKSIEVLKGSVGHTFTLERKPERWEPYFSDDNNDFDGHKAGIFWDKKISRQRNSSDCLMHPVFTVGERYLIFLGIRHWRGYEKISANNDRWLAAVRKLIQEPKLKSGFSQNIFEYLREKRALVVARFSNCPTEMEYVPKSAYMKFEYSVDHHIFGELPSELPAIPWFVGRLSLMFYDEKPGTVKCPTDEQFLWMFYHGNSKLADHYEQAAFPIDNGIVDFSQVRTEINLTGPRKIALEKLIKELQ